MLKQEFSDKYYYEIGVDEVGRGPLFGRVYASAVILPKHSPKFDYSKIKDSKKFSSEKKRKEVSDYIKNNCVAWGIGFAREQEIDTMNIRNATHLAMHRAIDDIIQKIDDLEQEIILLVDGNAFKAYSSLPYECVIKGDTTYYCIAAASIIAKVARDTYINDLCTENPKLNIYGLNKNKGYGTKEHRDAIDKYGITPYHRATFGICKNKKIEITDTV